MKLVKKKEDSFLSDFVKSFIIGLGIIFPVSASFLAVLLNMYDRILKTINNFFKDFKKNFKFLLALGSGIVLSCLVGCILMKFTLDMYPVATYLLFCGLVLGGIPTLWKSTKKKYTTGNFLLMIVGCALLASLSFFKAGGNVAINPMGIGALKLLGVGFISSMMIVPGVSGSALLVVMGYFEPLLDVITSAIKFQDFWTNVLVVVIFGVGMLLGFVILSKIIEKLMEKFPVKSYFVIIGFVAASVINIFVEVLTFKVSIIEWIIAILLFILGFGVSYKFIKEEN